MILTRYILGALATATVAYSAKKRDPVCIIGAGPAGLAAATALEQKGREVVIFEKQAKVGGKSQAVYKEFVARTPAREKDAMPYLVFSKGRSDANL